MINPIAEIKEILRKTIEFAIKKAIEANELEGEMNQNLSIEIPGDTNHGDFASNVALVSSRDFKKSPREISEIIKKNISNDSNYIDRIEIAGPGFLNFFLKQKWFSETVFQVNNSERDYGKSEVGKGKKFIVEYVSANPTGPMHMGNARGGVLGDTLSTALSMSGYEVTKEFYVNDDGNQVMRLGASLEARYLQLYLPDESIDFPEDGYKGDDIIERVEEYSKIYGDKLIRKSSEERRKELIEFTLPLNIEKIKTDLSRYRVEYDNWFLESSLHKDGSVDTMIKMLKNTEYTYEKDGALWFKSTEFGLEKDDVLVRENGTPTYFVVDIAYHYNKFIVRGFDKGVNIWGADHHGHVDRLNNALTVVGIEEGRLDILLMQMVRLIKDGEVVRMSKRTGKTITLTDLLDDVPISSARFFFNMREPNMAYDFDLDLAVKENKENPVYYVQYVYARICSLLKNLKSEDGVEYKIVRKEELDLLVHKAETDLIRHIAMFPDEIIEITKDYDPSRITRYSVELASKFHRFYHECKIKGSQEKLLQARLNLAMATSIVIKNILDMLKVESPEIM